MSEWIDYAEEQDMPYGTRMKKSFENLRLQLGQYLSAKHRKWHWSCFDENGDCVGSGIVPTQQWAKESAEEFAKKFLYPL
jgi:hypothetical protein